MNRKRLVFPLLTLLFAALSGIAQTPTCSDLKNGVFIYFSPADGSRQTYTRNGDIQKQVNPTTHETTIWDLEWVSDCAYLLTYNSGMEDRPKSTQQLLKKHKFFCQITSVTNDYYVVQTGLDKASNPVVEKDTLWIKQRSDAKKKGTTNPRIDSLLAIRKEAFDTVIARSAWLYAFRPGKFAESAVSYTLNLHDTTICEMGNKAAYIVRLRIEGPTTFVAKFRNQETSVTIDIKPGNKYYLRCELPWSLSPKPKLTEVKKEEAETYFDNVK
jgi:hypothetical protein